MADGIPYRILDEPVPSGFAAWAVNPLWPFLASMLAGQWLAVPWFIFNGRALGSATRNRELALSLAWFPAAFGLVIGIGWLRIHAGVSLTLARYLILSVVTCKLGLGYWLYALQERAFALHQHFNGRVRNGAVLVMIGAAVVYSAPHAIGGTGLLSFLVN